jgi:hypothetical protein
MDAYFEARVAFVDRPDARIRTDDQVHPGAIFVAVRERIDGEILVLRYSVPHEHPNRATLRGVAECSRRRWSHELDRRAPSEPFDMAKLATYVRETAHPILPLDVEVNQAWGGEMKMRLDNKVVLSPAAYREVRLNEAYTP